MADTTPANRHSFFALGQTIAEFSRVAVTMASPLGGCVASLRNSMQLLDSSINILDDGVNDFPRLAKVLQTTRVRFFRIVKIHAL
jgi:hypothetical protein